MTVTVVRLVLEVVGVVDVVVPVVLACVRPLVAVTTI